MRRPFLVCLFALALAGTAFLSPTLDDLLKDPAKKKEVDKGLKALGKYFSAEVEQRKGGGKGASAKAVAQADLRRARQHVAAGSLNPNGLRGPLRAAGLGHPFLRPANRSRAGTPYGRGAVRGRARVVSHPRGRVPLLSGRFPDHAETVRCAEDHAFRLVDIRIDLRCRLAGRAAGAPMRLPDGVTMRRSTANDVAVLKGIARRSYTDTRFFFDGHFPEERCEALYEVWIARSCEGWADSVWIADAVQAMAVGLRRSEFCDRDHAGGKIRLSLQE